MDGHSRVRLRTTIECRGTLGFVEWLKRSAVHNMSIPLTPYHCTRARPASLADIGC